MSSEKNQNFYYSYTLSAYTPIFVILLRLQLQSTAEMIPINFSIIQRKRKRERENSHKDQLSNIEQYFYNLGIQILHNFSLCVKHCYYTSEFIVVPYCNAKNFKRIFFQCLAFKRIGISNANVGVDISCIETR